MHHSITQVAYFSLAVIRVSTLNDSRNLSSRKDVALAHRVIHVQSRKYTKNIIFWKVMISIRDKLHLVMGSTDKNNARHRISPFLKSGVWSSFI